MTQAVGVIGAGRMGRPIIKHLVRNGHDVRVFDVDSGSQGPVEEVGASWCSSLELLGGKSQVVLVCVGFEADVRDLLRLDSELMHSLSSGALVAILSTVSPDCVEELSRVAAVKGVRIIDSTVCGGGWAADEGTLLSFVGGTAEDFEDLRPVIDAYSSRVVHSGGIGTAQVTKAVNNMILWACLVADHEGLALAAKYGMDIEVLRQNLLASSASNRALEIWGKQTMAWARDDLKITSDMAEACEISLPQMAITREICRGLKAHRYDVDKYGRS